MCGIIGIIGKAETKANEITINQYQDQIDRGTKGFGIIAIGKDEYKIKRATSEVKAIVDLHFMEKEHILLFHHRFPTSTQNNIAQTHPIKVSHDELKYDWLVMHNGVISNDDKLKKIHEEELGYVYTTKEFTEFQMSEGGIWRFNDSETFAIELARHLEEKEPAIRTKGSAAWSALKIDKKTDKPISILWGTNGHNPLNLVITDKIIMFASDIKGESNIAPDIANEVMIKDVFGKKELKDIINQKLIKFEPLAEPEPEWKKELHSRKIGFHTHNKGEHDEEKSSTSIIIPERNYDEEYEKWRLNNPLTDAFDKMHERVVENIASDLAPLFVDLSVEDIDEQIIEEELDNIREILMAARERAEKTRNFFDRQKKRNYSEEALTEDVDKLTRIT